MTSKDLKMSKQVTIGKMKYVNSMIPQKRSIIRRLDSGESQKEITTSYNIRLSTTI
jgi:hypothetical protein